MTLTRDDLAPLLGCRVHVILDPGAADAVLEGVLRFLPPDDTAVLADPDSGHEYKYVLTRFASVADARTTCEHPECASSGYLYNNTFLTRPTPDDPTPRRLCADHYRGWAQGQPAPVYACEFCSSGRQAFYSPRTKRFACMVCHGIDDALTGLPAEARFLRVQNAACRGADLDDLRHRWFHVRGHRYHCTLCEAKRFTDPPPGTLAARG